VAKTYSNFGGIATNAPSAQYIFYLVTMDEKKEIPCRRTAGDEQINE
jgi:hypothetical protein